MPAVDQEESVIHHLETDLPTLERQAAHYDAEAERLGQKANAIRQIIAGIKALNGDAEEILTRRFDAHRVEFTIAPPAEDGPRGPKAVLRIMREHPDRVWKVVEVKQEMLRRGWAPTPKAVEASIKRLRQTGDLVPVGYGFYKLPPAHEAPDDHEEEAA